MSDKFAGNIRAGVVDVSVNLVLRKKTDNTELTGIVYNTAGNIASYWRQGSTRTAITLATLANAGSAHSDGGFVEVDATNQPGLYRLDLPDAAVATGADWVVVTIVTTNGYAWHERFALESVGVADLGARLPTALTTEGNIKADTLRVSGTTQTARDIGAAVPAAGPGAAGGLFIAGTNAATSVTTALTANIVGNVTGNLSGSVGSVATNGITAASIAADAITAAKVAADVSAEIADAVWDEDATGHQTQGTFGQAIGDPGADTDTIFALVNTIQADTNDLQTQVGTAGNGLTAIPTIAAVTTVTTTTNVTNAVSITAGSVQAIWDAATSALVTIGSIGKKLADWVIGTAQTGDSFAIVNSGTIGNAVIKADTAAILVDTAEIGAAGAGLTALATQASVTAIDDLLDTEVAAIKADTAAILIDTAEIGAAGAGLTALASAAALAAVQSDTNDLQTQVGIAGAGLTAIPTIATVTTVTNLTNAPTAGDLTATMKTSVETAANAALVGQNLDHLVKSAVDTNFATTVHLDSVIGQLADNGTTATFDRTSDSLEAIRDKETDIETDTQDLQTQVGIDGAGLTSIPTIAAVTTVTNLTNAPTVGDLTAAMIASVTTAATAATPTAAAVTGNVGGNVAGDVAGKVLGGGVSAITGTGARVVDATGNDVAPASATTAIQADTDDIQARLPAALVGGRMAAIAEVVGDKTGYALTTGEEDAIVDKVWDELLSGHAVVGSTGAALTAAGSAGDPWSTPLPGAYGAGTAGKIVGDNLNATVGSRATQASVDAVDDLIDTEVAAIKADTAAILIDTAEIGVAGAGLTALAPASTALTNAMWTDAKAGFIDVAISSRLATAGYTAPPSAAAIVTAAWDELTATARTPGSYGQLLKDDINATISSRAPEAGGNVAAIQAKTTNLPTDPADQSLVIAATDALAALIGTPAGLSVSADVAAVKADTAAVKTKTDQLAFTTGNVHANVQVNSDKTGYTASVVSGGITAASFAAGAIDAASLSADAGTELATAVWANGTRTLTDLSGVALSTAAIDAILDRTLGDLAVGAPPAAFSLRTGLQWLGNERIHRKRSQPNQLEIYNGSGVLVATATHTYDSGTQIYDRSAYVSA